MVDCSHYDAAKEVIRVWWSLPYFQGHYIIKTLKESLVCTLSHESINGI